MIYIQYYENRPELGPKTFSKLPVTKWYVEGLGSSAVLQVDGRLKLETIKEIARLNASKRKPNFTYPAYRVMKGDRFNDSVTLSQIEEV